MAWEIEMITMLGRCFGIFQTGWEIVWWIPGEAGTFYCPGGFTPKATTDLDWWWYYNASAAHGEQRW